MLWSKSNFLCVCLLALLPCVHSLAADRAPATEEKPARSTGIPRSGSTEEERRSAPEKTPDPPSRKPEPPTTRTPIDSRTSAGAASNDSGEERNKAERERHSEKEREKERERQLARQKEREKEREAAREREREAEQARQREQPQTNRQTPDTRSVDTPAPERNSEASADTPEASPSTSAEERSERPDAVPQREPIRPAAGPAVTEPPSRGDRPVAVQNVNPDPEPPLREILLTTDTLEAADQQRRVLSQDRVAILSRRNLPGLGFVLSTYRVPEDVDMEALITELQERYPESDIERNQRYLPLLNEKRHYAQRMLGVAVPSTCGMAVPLAMLDSRVNTSVPALQGANIEPHDATGAADSLDENSPAQHGTAIATLMLSKHSDFPGLVPQASLLAVNVFARDGSGRDETRSNWLLYGLELVASTNPKPLAVNMSFGGDYSPLLEKVFQRLSARMVFVAAAGNDGRDQPSYPAAYHSVHGVGSLNAGGKRSRHSNHGAHIALMAPGEDVWTSGSDGKGLYVTGTSFAASFATVALALVSQSKQAVPDYLASLGESRQLRFEGLCGK